jgi:hypothetical protein
MSLNEVLVEFVAALPVPPDWIVQDIVDDADHPHHQLVENALRGIPSGAIEDRLSSRRTGWLYERWSGTDAWRRAQVDLLIQNLYVEVAERRRSLLILGADEVRPEPYSHPELSDLVPDTDRLVATTHFDTSRGGLFRGSWAFHLPPCLPASNSSYWTWLVL